MQLLQTEIGDERKLNSIDILSLKTKSELTRMNAFRQGNRIDEITPAENADDVWIQVGKQSRTLLD